MKMPFVSRRRHEREVAAMQEKIDDLQRHLDGMLKYWPVGPRPGREFGRLCEERGVESRCGTFRRKGEEIDSGQLTVDSEEMGS